MASEWQIIKDLYKGFGNNPRNAETFEALANINPLFSAYRGAKTLSNVDVSPMRQSLLNEAYGISDPNVNKQAANQVKDTLFGLLDVAPVAGAATPVIKSGGKTLFKEAARQIETGTGLLGSSAINPRINIVPVDVAKNIDMPITLPKSEEFLSAVKGTPNASITPEGLNLNLVRYQKPEQELSESVRTGVFYLPEGSANVKYYKNKGTSSSGNPYGGADLIQGETIYKNPLFVKGATGGKAPEEAYKQLLGKDKFNEFQKYVRHAASAPYKMREEVAYDFLQRYAPEIADNSWNIVQNSTQGNQLRYALQEAVIANEARKAGHDVILGYSKGKDGLRISEAFDLRESHYPSPSGEFYMNPEFEGLLKP